MQKLNENYIAVLHGDVVRNSYAPKALVMTITNPTKEDYARAGYYQYIRSSKLEEKDGFEVVESFIVNNEAKTVEQIFEYRKKVK